MNGLRRNFSVFQVMWEIINLNSDVYCCFYWSFRILNLNTDIFEDADIGRCSVPEPPEDNSQKITLSTTSPRSEPINQNTTPIPTTTTSTTTTVIPIIPTTTRNQGCAAHSEPEVDIYTLTFGNEADSFGEISNIRKNNINVR